MAWYTIRVVTLTTLIQNPKESNAMLNAIGGLVSIIYLPIFIVAYYWFFQFLFFMHDVLEVMANGSL